MYALTESGFMSKLSLAQSGHAQRARTMTGLMIEESEEASKRKFASGRSGFDVRVGQKIVSESQGEFDPGSG